jgi:hypothetical protein
VLKGIALPLTMAFRDDPPGLLYVILEIGIGCLDSKRKLGYGLDWRK